MEPKFSDDQLVEIARESLPLPSEVKMDYYRVPIMEKVKPVPHLFAPTGSCRFREVQFVKEYVRGIVIGWKFDGIK